ncbi:hypothetical protein F441_20971 [Phytophthora nicotianae CJ01A1]|nr:hypothetical protein F441_20971 [Phytophthora nicotianae CJ01A1]
MVRRIQQLLAWIEKADEMGFYDQFGGGLDPSNAITMTGAGSVTNCNSLTGHVNAVARTTLQHRSDSERESANKANNV